MFKRPLRMWPGRDVSDEELRARTCSHLWRYASHCGPSAMALIETAGGPASPSPSGRLQVPLFPSSATSGTPSGARHAHHVLPGWPFLASYAKSRPSEGCRAHHLQMRETHTSADWKPVEALSATHGGRCGCRACSWATARLGGISATIAAAECLLLRGYDTAVVAIVGDSLGNGAALRAHFGPRLPVIALPACRPPPQAGCEQHSALQGCNPSLQMCSMRYLCSAIPATDNHHPASFFKLGPAIGTSRSLMLPR